jgi:hypothetical protein
MLEMMWCTFQLMFQIKLNSDYFLYVLNRC